ncbi:10903_t:CDS:1, partial [Dentiscutata heterogama]
NAVNIRLIEEENFHKLEENDSIKILGFHINTKGLPEKNLWKNMIQKIKDAVAAMNN